VTLYNGEQKGKKEATAF